jgi:hypothetical protein
MSADVIVPDPITVGLSSRGGASLLLTELLGNQIEHKLFGFIANHFFRHFLKFVGSVVEY